MLDPILRRTRGRLPHWTAADATYFVTFRLFDSLPKELVDRFVFERRNIIQTAKQMRRELSGAERNRLHQLRIQIDSYLDQSHGKCYMRDEAIASMVAGALQYFEGVRYHLLAWCVMPNHVHSVVQLLENWELKQVLHSWKSFTAHQAVQKYHCSKPFWQVEPRQQRPDDDDDYDVHHARQAFPFTRLQSRCFDCSSTLGLESQPMSSDIWL